MTLFEKRREDRSPIELAASFGIGDEIRPGREANINNISAGGLCFSSESKLKVGQRVQLAIEMDADEELSVPVEVVWVNRSEGQGHYSVGVQIMRKTGPAYQRFMEFYNDCL